LDGDAGAEINVVHLDEGPDVHVSVTSSTGVYLKLAGAHHLQLIFI
jgi:hypothetical protein